MTSTASMYNPPPMSGPWNGLVDVKRASTDDLDENLAKRMTFATNSPHPISPHPASNDSYQQAYHPATSPFYQQSAENGYTSVNGGSGYEPGSPYTTYTDVKDKSQLHTSPSPVMQNANGSYPPISPSTQQFNSQSENNFKVPSSTFFNAPDGHFYPGMQWPPSSKAFNGNPYHMTHMLQQPNPHYGHSAFYHPQQQQPVSASLHYPYVPTPHLAYSNGPEYKVFPYQPHPGPPPFFRDDFIKPGNRKPGFHQEANPTNETICLADVCDMKTIDEYAKIQIEDVESLVKDGNKEFAVGILEAESRLCFTLLNLRVPDPVAYIYNPLDYARELHQKYVLRFGSGGKKILFLGMNPGPFGMAQNGVPFGDSHFVRNFLKMDKGTVKKPTREHPKRPIWGLDCPQREVSGSRFWGLIQSISGTCENFSMHCYVYNYCPLVFLGLSGKNITPPSLPSTVREPLLQACDRALLDVIRLLGIERIVAVGRFVEERSRLVLKGSGCEEVMVDFLMHPSPINPKANAGWDNIVREQLEQAGVASYFPFFNNPIAPPSQPTSGRGSSSHTPSPSDTSSNSSTLETKKKLDSPKSANGEIVLEKKDQPIECVKATDPFADPPSQYLCQQQVVPQSPVNSVPIYHSTSITPAAATSSSNQPMLLYQKNESVTCSSPIKYSERPATTAVPYPSNPDSPYMRGESYPSDAASVTNFHNLAARSLHYVPQQYGYQPQQQMYSSSGLEYSSQTPTVYQPQTYSNDHTMLNNA